MSESALWLDVLLAQKRLACWMLVTPLEHLFKRYRDCPVVKLIRNYRSHHSIVKLDSDVTYQGKMISGYENAFPIDDFQSDFRDILPQIRHGKFKPNVGQRVWFVDTPGYSEKAVGSSSSWNRKGVEYVVQLASEIGNLIDARYLCDVKIITMYSYEVGKIREQLEIAGMSDIDVQTVDSFKGKEARVVIIHCSAVWKDRHNPIGFLTDFRRLNVAITRAQNFMFIVGNLSFWKSSSKKMRNTDKKQSIKKLMEVVESSGVVVQDQL